MGHIREGERLDWRTFQRGQREIRDERGGFRVHMPMVYVRMDWIADDRFVLVDTRGNVLADVTVCLVGGSNPDR